MMVGPSGSGKTSAWRCLLSALEMADGIKGEAHVIDPKAIGESKGHRYIKAQGEILPARYEYVFCTVEALLLCRTRGVFALVFRLVRIIVEVMNV